MNHFAVVYNAFSEAVNHIVLKHEVIPCDGYKIHACGALTFRLDGENIKSIPSGAWLGIDAVEPSEAPSSPSSIVAP